MPWPSSSPGITAEWRILEDLRVTIRDPEHRRRHAQALAALPECCSALAGNPVLRVPSHLSPPKTKRSVELFTRFVFSALVDADFLDTEGFVAQAGDRESAERAFARSADWPSLTACDKSLDAFIVKLQASAADTLLNRLRRRVLEECVAAAERPRGAFSLTVPTGGGKTLASLAFALKHALANGQRRIVVVLPFTAIIDQTADVFRKVFANLGADVLVEHHSAVDPDVETRTTRTASENWDAPLVVTTQVQLFESLFSNRPSKCRKLHNLARSVIVLDEVQSLPHAVLASILDVLNELVAHYGVTLLLTTATQPSLHTRTLGGAEFAGLSPRPTEIVSGPLATDLWAGLRRVRVTWPAHGPERPEPAADDAWAALAQEIAGHERALAIVHLKRDARALHGALELLCPDALHLSAAMCPVHRRKTLAEVRRRLSGGEPCRLVSTQVIEAGVDVDFPVVFRAMAGLESLAQSAGRCNREGRLDRPGDFRVFIAPTQPPQSLRLHRDIARSMLAADPALDLFSPETFARYFDRVYANRDLDSWEIQDLRDNLKFASTATAFRMIDQGGESLLFRWNEAVRTSIRELRHAGTQPPAVAAVAAFHRLGLSPAAAGSSGAPGRVEEVHGYLVLGDFQPSAFHSDKVGLLTEADPSMDCVI